MTYPPSSRQVWIDEAARLIGRAKGLLEGGYATKNLGGGIMHYGALDKLETDEGRIAVMKAAAVLTASAVDLLWGEVESAEFEIGVETETAAPAETAADPKPESLGVDDGAPASGKPDTAEITSTTEREREHPIKNTREKKVTPERESSSTTA